MVHGCIFLPLVNGSQTGNRRATRWFRRTAASHRSGEIPLGFTRRKIKKNILAADRRKGNICLARCSYCLHTEQAFPLHDYSAANKRRLSLGIPIRSSLDSTVTQQYAALIKSLADKARSTIRDIDPSNELVFFRMRTKKHEILIAPGLSTDSLFSPSFSLALDFRKGIHHDRSAKLRFFLTNSPLTCRSAFLTKPSLVSRHLSFQMIGCHW